MLGGESGNLRSMRWRAHGQRFAFHHSPNSFAGYSRSVGSLRNDRVGAISMCDDRLGQGVVGAGFDCRSHRQNFILLELLVGYDFGHARLAFRQRASFIESNGSDATDGLQGVSALDQQTTARVATARPEAMAAGGQHQCAWTSN
jgi:hypothetical protein